MIDYNIKYSKEEIKDFLIMNAVNENNNNQVLFKRKWWINNNKEDMFNQIEYEVHKIQSTKFNNDFSYVLRYLYLGTPIPSPKIVYKDLEDFVYNHSGSQNPDTYYYKIYFPLLKELYSWINKISEGRYCYKNDISLQPTCECGNNLIFKKRGYGTFCSNDCYYKHLPNSNLSKLRGRNAYKTKKEKGIIPGLTKDEIESGYTNVSQLDRVKETKVRINMENYGVENYSQSPEGKKKISKGIRNSWNKLRNGFGFLYIVTSQELNLLKIGVTSNINNRLGYFKKDFSMDCKIHSLYSFENVFDIERILHKKYDEYNVILPTGGGRTEWFNMSILNDLIKENILKGNQYEDKSRV